MSSKNRRKYRNKISKIRTTRAMIMEPLEARELLAVVGSPLHTAVTSLDPEVYFGFDEASGTLANEGSLAGVGTAASVVAYGQTSLNFQFGTALDFDNSEVEIPINTAALQDGSGEFTYLAWFRRDNNSTGDKFIFGNDRDGVHFGVRNNNAHMGFWGNDLGSGGGTPYSTANEWHMAVFRYSGGQQQILVGEEGTTNVVQVTQRNGAALNRHGNLDIGRGNNDNNGAFEGLIDEVAIWDRALTNQELQDIYTAGLNPNASPVINDLDGDLAAYGVPASLPVGLDTGTAVSITDDDNPANFAGGTLTITNTSPAEVGDVITGNLGGIGSAVGGNSGVDYVATFNTNATDTLVESFLQSITFESGVGASLPSRTFDWTFNDGLADSNTASTSLTLDVGGVVDSYEWDGTGDGSSWNDASNWVGNTVPDANDIARFAGLDQGAVIVPAGTTFVGTIQLESGDYVIQNGTLQADAVTQTAGNNEISAQLQGVGIQITLDAGTLRLSDTSNPLISSANVAINGGTLFAHIDGANNFALGSAAVSIDGGTLEVASSGGLTVTPDALGHYGYHRNNDNTTLDLNNNGGMMGGGNPLTFLNFEGAGLLTDGPGNRGLDFNNDADFRAVNATILDDASGDGRVIDQNDNYSNLFVGFLNVSAADAGVWGLRNAGDDDRAGHWIDLNQNGVFESTTAGLGDNRGEQLSWENTGNKQVTLAAGSYLVAFTHREGGGGSRADFRFTRPGGSEQIIKPSDPAQAGLWSHKIDGNGNLAAGVSAVLPNDITIGTNGTAATGTVKLGASVIAASFNSLTLDSGAAAGATINADKTDASGSISFQQTNLNDGGANSLHGTNGTSLVLGDVSNGGGAGNPINVNEGTVVFSSDNPNLIANFPRVVVNPDGGADATLSVQTDEGLGNTGGDLVVLTGGTLALGGNIDVSAGADPGLQG
ncbi:MAG: hypothetical protein ACI9HK_005197, partial [Pirellulaceae bacterium]